MLFTGQVRRMNKRSGEWIIMNYILSTYQFLLEYILLLSTNTPSLVNGYINVYKKAIFLFISVRLWNICRYIFILTIFEICIVKLLKLISWKSKLIVQCLFFIHFFLVVFPNILKYKNSWYEFWYYDIITHYVLRSDARFFFR